ncbi:MAG TPA: translocation/assembly module TamB domain-containing protein [Trueperaceae bacterium]
MGGHLDVDIPVSDLLAAWPAEPLMLHGALEASGSLARPSFAGAVRLAGTLVATGELHASPKGASLTLDAPGLHLQGNLDRAGWRLDANAVAMDIADLLPQVAQPTISAVLHASQRWGGPLVADASSIALRSSRSDISGELRWAGQLSGSLRVNANLADVRVGGNEYRGTLTGRLAATGAGLSGQLEATALGLQDSPWALSGSIALAGDPASPTLDLELRGQGHAQGRLQASFAPAHHDLSFHSDLTIGPFQSDASISIAAGRSQARGKLAWGDFRVQVADGDQQGVILLRGFGRLAGWRAKLEPSRSRLSVAGSLQTLHPTISGLVALDWQWMEGIVGLSGQVSELQLGTLRLGKVAVAGQDHGATAIRVWGQALDARVSAAERGSWQLDRLEVPLTKDVTLQASGAGTLSELQLDAQLSAALPTQTVVLPFQLRYQQGVWRLLSDSELLSGHVLADLSHHDNAGWSGTLRLHQVSWHGLRINADTTAGGALVAPTLSGTLEAAWGQASLMAKLAADRHGATLDGKLDAPLLTRPLQVRGRLGSGASLTLQRAGGRGLVIAAGSDGGLVARGQLEVPAGPLSLRARPAEGGGVDLQLHLPPTGLAVGMTVPAKNLTTWLTAQLQGGLVLDGREATEGRVVVHFGATPALEVRDIRWSSEAGTLSLAGQVERQDAWLGNLVGAWQGSPATSGRTGVRTWPAGLKYLPFSLTLRRTSLRLDANSDALQVAASFDPRTLAFSMQGELKLDEGSTSLELAYKPSVGPSGTLRTEALPLMTAHGARSGPMTLTADIELEPDKVSGHATLASAGGRIEAEGNAGWARLLPATWRERFLPQAGSGLDAELRVATFDLANLPWVARRLPHLEAVVSGSAQLHADGIVGQLVAPDLRVEDSPLPSRLEFNGTPAALDVRATLADSRVDMSLQGGRVTGLADLQQFPLQVAAEAVVGASGVRALATGSVRFDLPLGAPGQGSVRAATQRIRLERNGVVSEGNVAFDYQAGSLVIERAEFTGAGSWTAQGRLTRERLDFSLSARDANFTPLLSLVPRLAELKVGAEGSMSLSLQGTPQEPLVSFESPDLELQLAGGHYLLEPLKLSLRGDVLKLSGELSGLSPIRGQLELHGGGRLQLRPWLAQDLQVQFSGQADIPPIGAIEGIRGTVRADPEAGWRLESSARLGQDFRLSGDLAPLNLQLTGQGLDIHAPRYFLTSSVTDVDLRLRYESAFLISGVVDVRQAMLSAAARGASPAPATAESARRPDWPTGKNPLYRDILFDKVRIRAPQEVRFEAGFGSAELSSDLTLTGSAAVPLLDGEVRALRGSVAFSGRDFSIDSAVASFDPSQGIYPTLAVQASTSYDKTDVLQGRNAGEVEFVAPRGSSSFEVFLDLTGEFRSEGVGPKQPDLTPELSSNALIQVQSEAAVSAGGPRPLDEQELVSLLALGRLDLDGDLLSETGLAGSVAQSALDTAVDVFILSELQEALGEALGVDLLQIRTSPLSSLLAGEGDFGVSLQLGGYLNEDVFATYRIGRFTGAGQDYAFTNEFNLRYDLAPVSFSLQGGVNFLNDTFTPVPEFGVSVDYGVTPFINLGANLDLSSIRQSFGIGLNIRW